MSVFNVLKNRGFVEQASDDRLIEELLGEQNITCYIGFDPTATSLHIGSLIPIMALVHMQRGGHRPIALVGGGTGLIGDPSGKSELRRVLTVEDIEANVAGIQKQLSRYLDFSGGKALMLNNAEWLAGLNYIEFLRDIGRHFSVNRMLAAESYRMRLETGLTFVEFNYMLLQSYDFYYLSRHYDCVLQMGGNDQWGNIVAGIDLTRRMSGKQVFGLTFPLITTSQGSKMGKTEKGTIWIDPELTSPYEYYQYWVNTDDADLKRFLALFTFLPMEEIRAVERYADAELNMAKSVLAYEATKITHGDEAARAAWKASAAAFGARTIPGELFPSSSIPRTAAGEDLSAIPAITVDSEILDKGIPAYELFADTGLCSSRGEARRLISQGGAYINGTAIARVDELIGSDRLDGRGEIRLRKGKKNYVIVRPGTS
ncbi:MAG: tyrosine--tRNA ligase [Syntrophales bacterium]|jgi:tyrosyl-tRNA synthetase|nr:tyrosine--tRNA ligase [Syntrophales bacterium]MCK9527561.1 tyrosine--tRNA ligase [Syntrophales bacterium]MDX9922618.1 tyrosine--tRNA ligase [Syntrophales bacterium]